jgi:hypothetical protein
MRISSEQLVRLTLEIYAKERQGTIDLDSGQVIWDHITAAHPEVTGVMQPPNENDIRSHYLSDFVGKATYGGLGSRDQLHFEMNQFQGDSLKVLAVLLAMAIGRNKDEARRIARVVRRAYDHVRQANDPSEAPNLTLKFGGATKSSVPEAYPIAEIRLRLERDFGA